MAESGPERPKLRGVEVRRVERDGKQYFVVTDPRRVSSQSLLVDNRFAPYLALADGTKTVEEIFAAGGEKPDDPSETEVTEVFNQLDNYFMLENERYRSETSRLLNEYHSADFRTPALEGTVYPEDPDDLLDLFEVFAPGVKTSERVSKSPLKAIITPHIDYERGGDTYAELWRAAAPDLDDVELAVIFGTDHNGSGPRMTLTRQSYATPWNILPTDTDLVSKLSRILETDPTIENHAYADEFNHLTEHSIELASIWLNWAIGDQPTQVLPVLCGSFGSYINGDADSPADHPQIADAIGLLQQVAKHRKTVFVAAADFAHVGPAFGDSDPVSESRKDDVKASDRRLLEMIVRGEHEAFLSAVKVSKDETRICGLAPIYLALRAASPSSGEWIGYRQCPTDEEESSFVSIAGALLHQAESTR